MGRHFNPFKGVLTKRYTMQNQVSTPLVEQLLFWYNDVIAVCKWNFQTRNHFALENVSEDYMISDCKFLFSFLHFAGSTPGNQGQIYFI